ncbi:MULTISPECIES: branched-chain amino acid ABC transporter permease [Roseovarius]|uniref:branched-chain amino acid ABC transporter permease n=1 Tax=Roseovarius TaxID=74030 RepID=UPI001C97D621|nr:branched-chain amino acid ABC transporter permease [Roseovarius atlanticus]MBY5989099.1 branched-chain amino acid ABC transporter permease [Roseovarius atlanticus]MBY6124491.1 branched-chain amino acid ABC transporter permease [Roseovarius atlanticus]MBY6148986.1 branched-chain amino acid ABC transporter permease [Roseovarius atlanticus]
MNWLQLIVDALSLGGAYALVALGIGLVFGVMRMINFAHGDLITLGAYALVVPSSAEIARPFIGDLGVWLMVPMIIGFVTLMMLATERFAFRPLRAHNADGASLLIASFAISYLIQNVILFVHTGRPKSVNILDSLSGYISIGDVRLPLIDVATVAATVVLFAFVIIFLGFTRPGREIRSASEDFLMARLLGVKANRVIAYAFAVSGVLAGAVSLLYVAKTGVLDYRMGVPLAIAGFVGTVLGGMGSLWGAMMGGLTLGIASALLQALLPPELRASRDAFLYGLVILVLLVRPQGIFSSSKRLERV